MNVARGGRDVQDVCAELMASTHDSSAQRILELLLANPERTLHTEQFVANFTISTTT